MANIYVAPKSDGVTSRDGSIGNPYWLREAASDSGTGGGDHIICSPGDYSDATDDVYNANNNSSLKGGSTNNFLWIEASDPGDKPKFQKSCYLVERDGTKKVDWVAFKSINWEVARGQKMVGSNRAKPVTLNRDYHADWIYFEDCEFHCTDWENEGSNTSRQLGFYNSEHIYFRQCSFHHGNASETGESNFVQFNSCEDVIFDECDFSECRAGHNGLSVQSCQGFALLDTIVRSYWYRFATINRDGKDNPDTPTSNWLVDRVAALCCNWDYGANDEGTADPSQLPINTYVHPTTGDTAEQRGGKEAIRVGNAVGGIMRRTILAGTNGNDVAGTNWEGAGGQLSGLHDANSKYQNNNFYHNVIHKGQQQVPYTNESNPPGAMAAISYTRNSTVPDSAATGTRFSNNVISTPAFVVLDTLGPTSVTLSASGANPARITKTGAFSSWNAKSKGIVRISGATTSSGINNGYYALRKNGSFTDDHLELQTQLTNEASGSIKVEHGVFSFLLMVGSDQNTDSFWAKTIKWDNNIFYCPDVVVDPDLPKQIVVWGKAVNQGSSARNDYMSLSEVEAQSGSTWSGNQFIEGSPDFDGDVDQIITDVNGEIYPDNTIDGDVYTIPKSPSTKVLGTTHTLATIESDAKLDALSAVGVGEANAPAFANETVAASTTLNVEHAKAFWPADRSGWKNTISGVTIHDTIDLGDEVDINGAMVRVDSVSMDSGTSSTGDLTLSAVVTANNGDSVWLEAIGASNNIGMPSPPAIGNPVANADSGTVDRNDAVPVDVLANDDDGTNAIDAETVEIVDPSEFGSTVVHATTGVITYTNLGNASLTDSFTYRVQDVVGNWSNPATVTITIDNVGPTAVNDSYTAIRGPGIVTNMPVLENDTDDLSLNTSSIVVTGAPSHGTAIPSLGKINYTNNGDVDASDSFTYTVEDNEGVVSNTATVTVTVIDQPPAAPVPQSDGAQVIRTCTENGDVLVVIYVGASSAQTGESKADKDQILRNILDETAQKLRVVRG